MKQTLLVLLMLAAFVPGQSQVSTDQFQVRIGYHLHNTYATRFNHLIETFNNDRYPVEISENMGSLNFMHGLTAGVNFNHSSSLIFHGIFNHNRQFLQARYTNSGFYRQFFFRENTVELGITIPLSEEKFIRHNVGGGLVLGYMSVFTHWTQDGSFQGPANMLNIDHTAVVGLNASYEVRFHFSDAVQFYLRPNVSLKLPSYVRNLNDFMNPEITADGAQYFASEPEKYNSGSLSGITFEGGLLISLPKLP